MSRSLYELCCRYANGELDTHEYRQLRRRFIDHLVNSTDRTQPATEVVLEEATQPHFSLLELQPDMLPADNKSEVSMKSSDFTENLEAVGAKTARHSITGMRGVIIVLLLLVIGVVIWLLSIQDDRNPPVLQDGNVSLSAKPVTAVPLLRSMYALLDLDKWSTTDIDDYSLLLLQSSSADKSVLKSDSRYHQFLDTVHIYQVLAEADQNEAMMVKLAQLERELRD
ncbi:hypothetical protein [Amphritea sp.]|uniref:hypothetical protein n=1 Tax=Amphritea sp. TaxID=1872502 RepID=UPI003D131BFF